MVAFEPLLEVRSYTSTDANFMLHHGLMGISYDVLFGENFDTFDNVGLKFRPVGVTINKRYNASFTLRYYPRRFTSEDFGIINPAQDKTAANGSTALPWAGFLEAGRRWRVGGDACVAPTNVTWS